ncbi:hypothetical protein JW905_00910 [bacterium]|nr:hypothetical protein [candidate division CSSED10-310 bacterium]
MSRRGKLIDRLFGSKNPGITYRQAENLLLHLGFNRKETPGEGRKFGSGSHRTFWMKCHGELVYCRLVQPHGKGDADLSRPDILTLRKTVERLLELGTDLD